MNSPVFQKTEMEHRWQFQNAAMDQVRAGAMEQEREALLQTAAEVEQESRDLDEQPVARRRARL